ncbi:MAG: riboflavin synthase [Acidimicrobiia bacterium]
MFTGIVETIGLVRALDADADHARVAIEAPEVMDGVEIGDSIALDGACLTVVARDDDGFEIEAVTETLRRTALGGWAVGTGVNVERAMPATGRFDGHIVQGHVDGVGTVVGMRPEGEGRRLTVGPPPELLRYVVEKGSITVDGVSLTVASVGDDDFDIALIPHTLAVTTLGRREPGDRVNLEVDVLAKYVERLLQP